ncbi:hypothetical protein [Marixanthomonas spongiae]|uniref:Uncharacterized protein n=1 Tax=Marixanthomonas spongiae TaxID=2174845 RepID=A0A2U0HYF2_9FLAO|nr:hypothetical protein [Marixanthomonas spongiae]PVW13902.1 hypothetical protein DDV96_12180 [Marixanthomonas spongiae]
MSNYDKIYVIGDALSNRPFRGVIEKYDLAEPNISRGEKKLDEVVRVKHSMGGNTLYNFIWTTNAYPMIVSKKVIELFKSNGITGWKTYDVEIYSKKDEFIDQKYYGLIIIGRCGYLDYSKNSIVIDKIGITTEPHSKGFYFKDDYWDGSDLFMCKPNKDGESNMFRFCTQKVADLIKKEKLKNISLEKATDFSMSISMYNIELTEEQKLEMEKIKASR